jgi:RNAse (barnase) inhibitor barstar
MYLKLLNYVGFIFGGDLFFYAVSLSTGQQDRSMFIKVVMFLGLRHTTLLADFFSNYLALWDLIFEVAGTVMPKRGRGFELGNLKSTSTMASNFNLAETYAINNLALWDLISEVAGTVMPKRGEGF